MEFGILAAIKQTHIGRERYPLLLSGRQTTVHMLTIWFGVLVGIRNSLGNCMMRILLRMESISVGPMCAWLPDYVERKKSGRKAKKAEEDAEWLPGRKKFKMHRRGMMPTNVTHLLEVVACVIAVVASQHL